MAFTAIWIALLVSNKFQPINRDTPCLLPPSVQDSLPEKHLARFVVEIVDQLVVLQFNFAG